MKRYLIFVSFFVIFSSYSLAQEHLLKRQKLDWEFFKNDRPKDAEHEALTWYRLSYRYRPIKVEGDHIQLQFQVLLTMDTAKSYFQINKRQNGARLLNHEQGHADIGVIYANKLNAAFLNGKFLKTNFQQQIKQIFDQIYAEMNAENIKYDFETNHSKNLEMQEKWDAYFKKEIPD